MLHWSLRDSGEYSQSRESETMLVLLNGGPLHGSSSLIFKSSEKKQSSRSSSISFFYFNRSIYLYWSTYFLLVLADPQVQTLQIPDILHPCLQLMSVCYSKTTPYSYDRSNLQRIGDVFPSPLSDISLYIFNSFLFRCPIKDLIRIRKIKFPFDYSTN